MVFGQKKEGMLSSMIDVTSLVRDTLRDGTLRLECCQEAVGKTLSGFRKRLNLKAASFLKTVEHAGKPFLTVIYRSRGTEHIPAPTALFKNPGDWNFFSNSKGSTSHFEFSSYPKPVYGFATTRQHFQLLLRMGEHMGNTHIDFCDTLVKIEGEAGGLDFCLEYLRNGSGSMTEFHGKVF